MYCSNADADDCTYYEGFVSILLACKSMFVSVQKNTLSYHPDGHNNDSHKLHE